MGKKDVIKIEDKEKAKKDVKLQIDERFQSMFTDKNFKLKYVTDKRGRPVEHTSSKDLKEFYSASSFSKNDKNAQENIEERRHSIKVKDKIKKSPLFTPPLKKGIEIEKTSSESSDEYDIEKDVGLEKDLSSEDSSETSSDLSDEDDAPGEEFDHKWEEWDTNAPVASEITKRLALCNMDWDRIRAEDILVVFNSFKPANGVIHSVKIYPSKFGLQRMENEKFNGPTELVEETLEEDENVKETKEGSKYHREKLRQYQLNRLKYYFAVIECDSPETADSLYEELNGMEYESSAVCMDLRFIPNDTTFDQEPKWVAETVSDPIEYKPRLFANSALQQVKVNLTWDETDPKRRELIQKAFREPAESIEKDIKIYLASSSSDSEDDDVSKYSENENRDMKLQERISKYKELLQSIEEKEKEEKNKYEMEITWEPGLKDETEKKVKEKIANEALTPFEEKLRKKKEDRKLKLKNKKLLVNKKINESDVNTHDYQDNDDDNSTGNDTDNHFSDSNSIEIQEKRNSKNKMVSELSLLVDEPENTEKVQHLSKKKKKKLEKMRKEMKADKFEVNVHDSRFSAVYTSHLYNIDPSSPHFKDSKAMQAIVNEKLKRKSYFPDKGSPKKEIKKHKQLKNYEDDSEIDNSIVLI